MDVVVLRSGFVPSRPNLVYMAYCIDTDAATRRIAVCASQDRRVAASATAEDHRWLRKLQVKPFSPRGSRCGGSAEGSECGGTAQAGRPTANALLPEGAASLAILRFSILFSRWLSLCPGCPANASSSLPPRDSRVLRGTKGMLSFCVLCRFASHRYCRPQHRKGALKSCCTGGHRA